MCCRRFRLRPCPRPLLSIVVAPAVAEAIERDAPPYCVQWTIHLYGLPLVNTDVDNEKNSDDVLELARS
jgi:hypothetical protein